MTLFVITNLIFLYSGKIIKNIFKRNRLLIQLSRDVGRSALSRFSETCALTGKMEKLRYIFGNENDAHFKLILLMEKKGKYWSQFFIYVSFSMFNNCMLTNNHLLVKPKH